MAKAKDKKISKTFRLNGETIKSLENLAVFFNDSQAGVIERAVDLLNENKKLEAKREYDKRIGQIEGN